MICKDIDAFLHAGDCGMDEIQAQQFDEFLASKNLSEEDLQDIMDGKDLLIQKGFYAARYFHRATQEAMEKPPWQSNPWRQDHAHTETFQSCLI